MVEVLTVEKLFQKYCEASYSLKCLPPPSRRPSHRFWCWKCRQERRTRLPEVWPPPRPCLLSQVHSLLTVAAADHFQNILDTLPFNQVFHLIIPLTSFSLKTLTHPCFLLGVSPDSPARSVSPSFLCVGSVPRTHVLTTLVMTWNDNVKCLGVSLPHDF